MHHHQLIGINDLIKLTTQDLRDLDARLRHILDHGTDLTDRDIAVIVASLLNILVAYDLRNPASRTITHD